MSLVPAPGSLDRSVAGRRDRSQQRCRGAHHTDQLAIHLDGGGRRDLRRIRRGVEIVGPRLEGGVGQDLVGEKPGEIAVTAEVQIGAQIGKLTAEPAHISKGITANVGADDVFDGRGSEVEFMIAERRGVEADDVHDGDVDAAGRLAEIGKLLAAQFVFEQLSVDALQRVAKRSVAGGAEERSGYPVVAGRDGDGTVDVGAVFELVDDRGKVGRAADGVDTSLEIGGMQELQREGFVDLIDRRRAADFVGDDQKRLAVRRIIRRYERKAFGSEIAGLRGFRIGGEVAVVVVTDKPGVRGIADILGDGATDPFQADKCVGREGNDPDGDAFRFRTFGVAPGVEGALVIVGIEVLGDVRGDDFFESIAAVEHKISELIPDGEGPAAVGEELVVIAIAVDIAVNGGYRETT